MTTLKRTLAAAALATALAGTAQAALVEVTSKPVATGAMTVVFAFVEAADRSTLQWTQSGPPAATLITNNGAGASALGTTVAGFGAAGVVDFILDNTSQGYSFTAGVRDLPNPPGDGLYHAKTSANFADFGVGALSAAASTAIATARTNTGQQGIFIGFEDRRGGDYDYNDLIYWFSSVRVVDAPAPAALGLFGLGLLGLGLMRRRA
ncbi:PEP-CTERM sorting domain-containing protein [Roseococcus sp. DSY-14]|uniref:PEP-CTERM sorting domain-containing protein n=1 Tax=Roseococcus sp. DSY-14 TaxID=3369650 RepID=UPI00387AFBCE